MSKTAFQIEKISISIKHLYMCWYRLLMRQGTNYSGKSSNRLLSVPMPGITISIVVPGFIGRAPTDVPQLIKSPGSNV